MRVSFDFSTKYQFLTMSKTEEVFFSIESQYGATVTLRKWHHSHFSTPSSGSCSVFPNAKLLQMVHSIVFSVISDIIFLEVARFSPMFARLSRKLHHYDMIGLRIVDGTHIFSSTRAEAPFQLSSIRTSGMKVFPSLS
jgi:hypothetical protein